MKLENYIYIVDNTHGGFVAWVKDVKSGMQQLMRLFPETNNRDRMMARHILTLVFDKFRNPVQDVQRAVGFYAEGNRVEHTYSFDGRDEQIRAIVTPMAFKGNSATLGTLKLGDTWLTMMRRSQDQALSIDVYANLIRDDIESYEQTGRVRLWREQCARAIRLAIPPSTYLFIDGEKKCPLNEISIRALRRAGADLDETAVEILEQLVQLRLLVPHDYATVPMARIWYTPHDGQVFIGKYPVTYGKYQGQFLMFGMMFSNFFADIRGKMLEFTSKGKTYEVICEED